MSVLKGKSNVDHTTAVSAQAQNIMKTSVDEDLNYKMMLIMSKMNDDSELKINKESLSQATQLLPTSQQDSLDFLSTSTNSFTNVTAAAVAAATNATAAVHQKVVLNNAPSMISNSNSSPAIAAATFAVAEQGSTIHTKPNACSNFEPHYWRFVFLFSFFFFSLFFLCLIVHKKIFTFFFCFFMVCAGYLKVLKHIYLNILLCFC